VIIDTLVQPGMPISDMRTTIHGITEADLRPVQFTLRHAQAALLSLCSDRTILVGHGLSNDLKALHFQHNLVVDSSFLYSVQGEPGAQPSLRDVSKSVFGVAMPPTHDSTQDARTALAAAVYYASSTVGSTDVKLEVLRTTGNGSGQSNSSAQKEAEEMDEKSRSLLIHRIPDSLTEEQIQQMFISSTFIIPVKILPIARDPVRSGDSGKTSVLFSTVAHAELALATIPGPERPDNIGRAQKRIYLRGGGYIYARKFS